MITAFDAQYLKKLHIVPDVDIVAPPKPQQQPPPAAGRTRVPPPPATPRAWTQCEGTDARYLKSLRIVADIMPPAPGAGHGD